MLRLSNLHRQVTANGHNGTGQSLSNRLIAVRTLAKEVYAAVLQCLHSEIVPKLEKSGIHLLDYSRLTKHQKEWVYNYFKKTIHPLLIHLPLGHGHAFPHISNLYLNLAVVLKDRKENIRLMRLQVPDTLPLTG